MKLSKVHSRLLLIATLLPLLHLLFFMITFFAAVLGGLEGDGGRTWFVLLFVAHGLCMLWIWALTAFYLVFLFKTDVVPKDQKALWAVVLFLGNVLAMPIFWYLYIWSPKTKPVSNPLPV
jgi:hypothetical protein